MGSTRPLHRQLPLFLADRINTPLLIKRRLGKEAVLLQYRSEGHHLAKYANKLDYAMKMEAFFEHYLKGEPVPRWLEAGIPYAREVSQARAGQQARRARLLL